MKVVGSEISIIRGTSNGTPAVRCPRELFICKPPPPSRVCWLSKKQVMASSYNLNDLKRTRLAARDAMAANEAHQQRVREHIQELEASLENLDAMLVRMPNSDDMLRLLND